MTTVAITTTSLPAHQLAEALDQVMPHMAKPQSSTPILSSVHFDNDGTYLHAVTTDRYTLAVARRRLRSCDDEWTATVGAMHVTYLQSWAEAHSHRDTIELAVTPGQMTAVSNMGRIVLPTMGGAHAPWRALFNKHLEPAAETVDISGLDTQYLNRWAKAGRHLQITQASAEAPFVVAGPDFLGMQMPIRQVHGEAPSRAALTTEWAGSLGFAVEPGVDLPLSAENDNGPTMTEDLLKQVLISSQELYDVIGGTDYAAMGAHSRAGSHAWIAHRLLQVLRVIDPRTTELALADIADELDGGDFAETAFDEAEQLGHDPQAWIDTYIEGRRKRAEATAEQANAQG
ncbi:MAG: hypothetical protein HOW97_39695 [Catenulispora sp.]|nr:hypothetical protein [Catenulispora sp.]NUS29153.1 hypothetical protein [Streptomyces sp.]